MKMPQSDDLPKIDYNFVHLLLVGFSVPQGELPDRIENLLSIQNRLDNPRQFDRSSLRIAANRWVHTGLERFAGISEEAVDVLRLRFIEGRTGRDTADYLEKNIDQFNRLQRSAIHGFVDVLNDMESIELEEMQKTMIQRLGGRHYGALFGIDQPIQEMINLMIDGDPAELLVITGMGGIGKSTLADAAIRQVIRDGHFVRLAYLYVKEGEISADDLVWELAAQLQIRAEGEQSTTEQMSIRIGQLLKTVPHLIYIDGIEESITEVIRSCARWSNPSKIVITSREGSNAQTSVRYFEVRELSKDDSAALLHHTLHRLHQSEPFELPPYVIDLIYDKVGGNPLAVKMVASLTEEMTILEIVEDLKLVDNPGTVELYKRIFIKIWDRLDEKSQQVLVSLALFGQDGISKPLLVAMNQPRASEDNLNLNQLQPVNRKEMMAIIKKLTLKSLLETYGDMMSDYYRYGIHNLTRSFLLADMIELPAGFRPTQ